MARDRQFEQQIITNHSTDNPLPQDYREAKKVVQQDVAANEYLVTLSEEEQDKFLSTFVVKARMLANVRI